MMIVVYDIVTVWNSGWELIHAVSARFCPIIILSTIHWLKLKTIFLNQLRLLSSVTTPTCVHHIRKVLILCGCSNWMRSWLGFRSDVLWIIIWICCSNNYMYLLQHNRLLKWINLLACACRFGSFSHVSSDILNDFYQFWQWHVHVHDSALLLLNCFENCEGIPWI